MSFREKSAWVSLVSILLVSLLYWMHLPWPPTLRPSPDPALFHALVLCIAFLIAIEIGAHVVLALRSPGDARTPEDEREQLIALRSTRLAARVYAVGTFLAVLLIHYGANAIALGNGILLSFVVAQVVNYGVRIIYHRRGF